MCNIAHFLRASGPITLLFYLCDIEALDGVIRRVQTVIWLYVDL